MRSRKFLVLLGCICLVLIVLPVMTACSSSNMATSGDGKTLKIGYIGFLGLFIGVDTQHCLEVEVNAINQKGGLTIGKDKYKIDLITYDSNFDQATTTTAVNRLIFQDNVKFIVSDGFTVDAMIPITEANKVVLCCNALSPAILSPDNHYSFMVGFQNTETSAVVGWLSKTFPGEDVVFAVPDNQQGKVTEMVNAPAFKAFNMNATFEFYPANATDLSALGTKVVQLNPGLFTTAGGGHQPFNAVLMAGYKGQLFSPSTPTADDLLTTMTAEQIEGFIGGAAPTEFEPALTERAKKFKEGWIAKFGSWGNPYLSCMGNFDCLVTALEKAGSVDTDAVASVIGSGLQFDSVTGPAVMISRPDMGNDRTIDSLHSLYMKKITGGKAKLLYTIDIEECRDYFLKANQATAAKQ